MTTTKSDSKFRNCKKEGQETTYPMTDLTQEWKWWALEGAKLTANWPTEGEVAVTKQRSYQVIK